MNTKNGAQKDRSTTWRACPDDFLVAMVTLSSGQPLTESSLHHTIQNPQLDYASKLRPPPVTIKPFQLNQLSSWRTQSYLGRGRGYPNDF
ncbi:hypothetical protein HAX54_047908, partial [Datura stramonium]|nr:hypothetical protein [Datura stramonium]